jgi:T4 beta protein
VDPFNERSYVPILLTKRGERRALEAAPAHVGEALRPLFVVPEPDWDFEKKKPKKTENEHLATLPDELILRWGSEDAFLDMNLLSDTFLPVGMHPLHWVAANAHAVGGLALTPVVTMDSTDDYIAAAAQVVDDDITDDVCLRFSPDAWIQGGSTTDWDYLMSDLGVEPMQVHLVLDLGDEVDSSTALVARDELLALPYVNDWASVTVTGTGLPQTLPSGGSTVHTVPRQEWKIYEALCGSGLPRTPSFGDYAVNGPEADGPGIDPKVMSMSATLRYTTKNDWLISKGGLYKGTGGKGQGGLAVPPAAAALLQHQDYLGDAHCAYEPWLISAAAGGPPGNAETWRKWGTLHHLHVVTDQVASLHGP